MSRTGLRPYLTSVRSLLLVGALPKQWVTQRQSLCAGWGTHLQEAACDYEWRLHRKRDSGGGQAVTWLSMEQCVPKHGLIAPFLLICYGTVPLTDMWGQHAEFKFGS